MRRSTRQAALTLFSAPTDSAKPPKKPTRQQKKPTEIPDQYPPFSEKKRDLTPQLFSDSDTDELSEIINMKAENMIARLIGSDSDRDTSDTTFVEGKKNKQKETPTASVRPKRRSTGAPVYKEEGDNEPVDAAPAKRQKLAESDDEKENVPSSSKNKKPAAAKPMKSRKITAMKKHAVQLKKAVTGKEPKKRKTKLEKIHERLKAIGIKATKNKNRGNCVRAAMYKGFVKLTGNLSDLDQVVLSGKLDCGHECTATVRDLMEQPDYAGMDYEDGSQNAVVLCDANKEEEDSCEEGRTYVTGMCQNNASFDCGKFHNHCVKCDKFGVCIGDYREKHCGVCKKHYFAGSGSQFRCDCRSRGRFGGFGGRLGFFGF